MCTTAKRLAEVMKSDGAILLSVLYRKFYDKVRNKASLLPHLSSTPDQWLLSRLNSLFGDSLQVHCKQDRYGSVLFHKDCDLVKALSTALGKCQTLQKQLKEQWVDKQYMQYTPCMLCSLGLFSVMEAPLPLSGTLSQEEILRGNGTQKRQFSLPVASPMPVEKHKHRRRTLTEQPSPHTHMTQPRLQDSPIFLTDEYQAQCLPQMTIHHYRLHAVEYLNS